MNAGEAGYLLSAKSPAAAGAAGIAAFRAAADLALLPGATFREEVLKGNLAVGVLDVTLTAGIAILLTWCLF